MAGERSNSIVTDGRAREFELPAYRLAALEWGEGLPVLALHGWLDNAASFALVAPLIRGCRIVALDAAGHGLSGNRSIDSAYNIWQDVGDVHDVAEQLEWDRFNLLGHSRGAGVAMLFAAAFPERVDRMVFLDGGMPIVAQAEEAPRNLARAVVESRALRSKSGRFFPTREAAIAERMNGFTKVGEAAASLLAERSLIRTDAGWQWQADQRVKARSELMLTRELTAAFIRGVRSPVQIVLAEQGPFRNHPIYVEMLPKFSDADLHTLPGNHHFHMEGAQERIAELATEFLVSNRDGSH